MPYRFSDEVEYTFDCAVECGELTYDVPLFLKCFYPGDTVIEHLHVLRPNDILSRSRSGEGVTGYLTRMITERCDELRAHGGYDRLVWHQILLQSISVMAAQGREMSELLAHDMAMGVTEWGEIFPQKKAIRRSRARSFQRKFARNHGMFRMFSERAQRLTRVLQEETKHHGLQAIFRGPTVNGDSPVTFDELNEALRVYNRLGHAPWSNRRMAAAPTREQRKMLRRATKLATAVVGEHAVYDFMRGKPVFVVGKDFVYKAEMRNPFYTGHGSTSIQVCDHDFEPLADLCVYFEKSPALDHLAALRMHCDAGEDVGILYDANVTREFPRASHHAAFQIVREAKKNDRQLNNRLHMVEEIANRNAERERAPRELENEVVRLEAGGVTVDVPQPDNTGSAIGRGDNLTPAIIATDPQIRLWVQTSNPQIVVQNIILPSGAVLPANTRVHSITNGITYVQYSGSATTSTPFVSATAGGTTSNFTITSVTGSTSNTLTWTMPQLTPEQVAVARKMNSRYMQFRRNAAPQRNGAQVNKNQKKKYYDRFHQRMFQTLTKTSRLTDNLVFERWSESYAKNEDLRADMLVHVFEEITRRPKLARVLMGLTTRRPVSTSEQAQLRDMLRDDNGELPPNADEILQNAHVDRVENFEPYDDGLTEDDFDDGLANFEEPEPINHAIRQNTARLTVAVTSRMLTQMQEDAEAGNPFEPMANTGDEQAARNLANRMLGNTFQTTLV